MVYDDAPATPAAPAAPAPVAPAAPAAPAAGSDCGDGATLHDFVLGLLQDASAMKAFDLDPVGCLKDAGLTDITPDDVKDVIPLVTELVPTGGLPGLPGLGAIPGLDGLPSLPGLDGLPHLPGVPSLDDLTTDLDLTGDAGIEDDAVWAVGHVGAETAVAEVTGDLAAVAGYDGIQTVQTAGLDSDFGTYAAHTATDIGTDRVAAAFGVAGVDTPVGLVGVNGIVDVVPGNGVNVDTDVALGNHYISIDSHKGPLEVEQNIVPGLPNVSTGELTKGLTDPTAAASAIVGAVPALPGVPGLPVLPIVNDLPLPEVPALPQLPTDLPVVGSLPVVGETDGVVGDVVDTVQDTVGGAVGDLTDGGLPSLGGHLPQLPDVGGVVGHLPVVSDLPAHLPAVELPQLPSLPVGGNIEVPSVVGDVVDHTGLGGVINNNPVTGVVHDIVPDLHLGL